MDLAAHLLSTARHLIRMADDPLTSGKAGHAALRLEELKALDPMYEALPQIIAQERARMAVEGK